MAERTMVYCRSCGQPYRAKPEMAGRKFKCKCGGVVAMPEAVGTGPGVPTTGPAAAAASGAAPAEEDWNYDAVAGLGSETQASTPPPLAPAYKPKVVRPKRERAGGGGGGVGRWLKGGFAAIFSREPVPKSREQHLVQYWVFGPGFVVVGIVFILVGRHFEQRHEAFMKVAQKTTARIVHEPTIREERQGRRVARFIKHFKFPVVYAVEGGREMQKEIEVSEEALPPGFDPENSAAWLRKELDVYYDPADPGHVEAAVRAERSSWFWGYVVGGVFAAIGAWGAVTKWPY